MPVTLSPLRYPGGKAKLYGVIKQIIDLNNLHGTYIEPFAGGAGLAIKLLLNDDVNRIVINDSDPAIYAFWRCVLFHTDDLCEFVRNVPLTYEEWTVQRNIYFNQNAHTEQDIGKAVLFLNRTNRSGIIKGGVIGGKAQQGTYPMSARFNREGLVEKIHKIAEYAQRIDLYNLDALALLSHEIMHQYSNVFINFDPPYVEKGGQLYMNYFSADDHKRLFDAISKCNQKWVVTYDVCDLTKQLYQQFRSAYINLIYSATTTRHAQEYIFFSDSLIIPNSIELIQ